MFYETRNRNNVDKLADNTKKAAIKLIDYAKKNNINILIYETIRTLEQQKKNVANGASQTMKSYHLVGQALDFVLVDNNGQCLWNAYKTPGVQQFVKYAKSLGFTWGGDWTKFVDSPHLQFEYKGYGTDTFHGKSTTVKVETEPVKPVTPVKKWTSLVDYLKYHGANSSFAARSQLALKFGIKNYTGTATQNTKLLELLQQKQ